MREVVSHMWERLWLAARIATMTSGRPYGLLEDAALAVDDGSIAWVGERSSLPAEPARCAREVLDVRDRLITPGLIDCHTHLVYAGNRAREFEMRLEGASYEQIARSGGGILSTVNATRAASYDDLLAQSIARAEQMALSGTTTVEIKSGYGLDLETERKILRVARAIADQTNLDVHATYLGAHAVPPEYTGRSDDYVAFVCETVLPQLAAEGLIDSVDAFCERIAFDAGAVERIFTCAASLGLRVRLHADQLSDGGGSALAARHRALSADHLEHASAAGIEALAQTGTVAVLLPGATFFLRETHRPPLAALREAGVPLALATDCNPGTSPMTSLPLAMNMACTQYGMRCEEALAAVTVNAARALGLKKTHGTLAPGYVADLAMWDAREPAELAYGIGLARCVETVKRGATIVS